MKTINSLVLLINTLSKAEKKAIFQGANIKEKPKAYMELFDLIDKKKITEPESLKEMFGRKYPHCSLIPEANYLYDHITKTLVALSLNKDKRYALYQKVLQARVLKDRNLEEDYYGMLDEAKEDALLLEDYNMLAVIQRLKLDSIRRSNFLHITEEELLREQKAIKDIMKTLCQINEQSTLYELFLFYLNRNSETAVFTELAISEISLVNNLKKEIFEVEKRHLLFQGNYLNCAGDYKAACTTFEAVDQLFCDNKHLWNNPPADYMNVLEGILKTLCNYHHYDQMNYFIEKLNSIQCYTNEFNTEVDCIVFLYETSKHIHNKDIASCEELIEAHKDSLLAKKKLLTPYRNIQLLFQLALIAFMKKDLSQTRKLLFEIINNKSYGVFSLYKLACLMHLIVAYDAEEYELVASLIRSMKRRNKQTGHASMLEKILFTFLNSDQTILGKKEKALLKQEVAEQIRAITNIEDKQMLKIFDFEDWILNKI